MILGDQLPDRTSPLRVLGAQSHEELLSRIPVKSEVSSLTSDPRVHDPRFNQRCRRRSNIGRQELDMMTQKRPQKRRSSNRSLRRWSPGIPRSGKEPRLLRFLSWICPCQHLTVRACQSLRLSFVSACRRYLP